MRETIRDAGPQQDIPHLGHPLRRRLRISQCAYACRLVYRGQVDILFCLFIDFNGIVLQHIGFAGLKIHHRHTDYLRPADDFCAQAAGEKHSIVLPQGFYFQFGIIAYGKRYEECARVFPRHQVADTVGDFMSCFFRHAQRRPVFAYVCHGGTPGERGCIFARRTKHKGISVRRNIAQGDAQDACQVFE